MRLIADDAPQQVLPLAALLPNPADDDKELVIAAAEIAGLYVLLLLSDGAAILLCNRHETGNRTAWYECELDQSR